jgi:Mg2+ and Co2+ transporter CorA
VSIYTLKSIKSIYQDQHPSVFQDLFKSRKYSNWLKCIKPDAKGI